MNGVLMGKYVLSLMALCVFMASCSTTKKKSGTVYKKPNSTHTIKKKPEATDRAADATASVARGSKLASNKKLAAIIDDWYGVPHKVGGKDKHGIDCSGLTTVILKDVYGVQFSGPSYVMESKAQKIDRSQLREGDLVFFKIESSKVSHVGVYLNDGYFVHATLRKGVMISSLSEPYYTKYYYSAGRAVKA